MDKKAMEIAYATMEILQRIAEEPWKSVGYYLSSIPHSNTKMSHVRKMLRKLAEKGYLTCERDGSMKRIRLTEKGWKFVMNGKKGTSANTILYPMALRILKKKTHRQNDGRTKHSI